MPAYIVLGSWTQKGIENIKQSPTRLDAAKKVFEAQGGKLTAFYMTMGQYDFVVLSECPNDESAAKAALSLGAAGGVRTETLKAFSEAEYRKIIGSLP
ncbi:MAG: GYD domain-containing protein [Acidobacteriia bacterium]|nr:GYD domain-containing protein [Terriglobia bacterium]